MCDNNCLNNYYGECNIAVSEKDNFENDTDNEGEEYEPSYDESFCVDSNCTCMCVNSEDCDCFESDGC